MDHPPTLVRRAFADAVDNFLQTAALIDAAKWDDAGTDQWSVLQLFSHTARGMNVVVDYLDVVVDPSITASVDSASLYFRVALSNEGIHQGIVERARAAAADYRDDPLGTVTDTAARVLTRVAVTPDDRVMQVFAETIRFVDYLETRTVELVLHTFDLQLACGLELRAPLTSLGVVNDLLLTLVDRADGSALALALSGRPSPLVCNVLG